MRSIALLLCTWIAWHMQVVDRTYFYTQLSRPTTQGECLKIPVKKAVITDKKPTPVKWYASGKTREDGIRIPDGKSEWYGCFPEDYSPREDK